MSNQIVISSGAKVRSLEGVLTGTAGIVSSVPLGAANGVATLDSSGKVPLSQLPASVVTYLGTWNAATNTPTLANGTGDVGDLYICNVAGTVNFGAGPITFAVGDWVIYSGTEWQKSSGATGTVTSVAVTESGDALTITGSPITTAGTINIGFAGNSTQYINGEGNLVTFPTIITEAQNLVTEVYNETGSTLIKGTIVYINGGHGNLPTITKAIATSDATSAQTYGVVRADISNNNNGYVTVIGSLTDIDTQAYAAGTQLYLSGTTAGAWTSTKPSAPIHLVYVGIVVRSHPTQGVVEVRIQNGYELEELHDVAISSPVNNQGIFYNSSTDLWENKSIATALGYTPANAATYVPYTGATSNVDLGIYNLIANNRIVGSAGSGGSAYSNTIFVSSTSITSGYENTIIGWGVGSLLTTGYYNTAVGGESLALITTGNDNTAFGGYALSTVTGSYNTGIGSGAGRLIGSGSYNTIIGGYNGTSGMSSNVILSDGAGNIRYRFDGTNNNFYQNVNFGSTLGNGTYTYTLPSATGTLALTSDIPSLANYVTLTGPQTITGIKTFTNEQLFGNGITLTGGYITYTSGAYNLTLNTNILTANRNIYLQDGSGTLAFTSDIPSLSGYVPYTGATGAVNLGAYDLTVQGITFGLGAIGQVTNLAIGVQALAANTSTSGGTTAIGYQTLTANTSGYQNTGVGYAALVANTSGLNNTALGASSLSTVTTGRDNIGIGLSAGQGITTGSYNTIIGKATGLSSSLSNNIILADGQGNIRYQWNGTNNVFSNPISGTSATFSGDLTVSATQPNSYLTYTDATSYARMLFYESATYKGVIQFMGSSFVTTSRRNALEIINGTTGDIAMGSGDTRTFYIKNGGNVGIGTSSPISLLSLKQSGTTYPSGISITDSSNDSFLGLYSTGSEFRIQATYLTTGSFLPLTFFVGGGERMRITSSGNVGIGTSSPSANLEINNSGDSRIYLSSSTGNGSYIRLINNSVQKWFIGTNATGAPDNDLAIYGYGGQNGNIISYTNGSERMRITSGGEVCVNRTSGSGKFNIDGTFYMYNMTTGAGNSTLKYNTSTGLVTNDSSARIFKKDITNLEYGLDDILKMSPKQYKWKLDDSNDLGFIADEMYEIIPEIVSLANNSINKTELQDGEPMGINYDRLVPVLVKAIQELTAKVTALENK